MSTAFIPTPIRGNDAEHYDGVVTCLVLHVKDGDLKAAEVCERELRRLDLDWAKQKEP